MDDLSVDSTPEGISRKENIQELLNAIKDFSETAYKEGANEKLPAFLEGVALLTDQDSEKAEDNNKVTLMTIHAAKGFGIPQCLYDRYRRRTASGPTEHLHTLRSGRRKTPVLRCPHPGQKKESLYLMQIPVTGMDRSFRPGHPGLSQKSILIMWKAL